MDETTQTEDQPVVEVPNMLAVRQYYAALQVELTQRVTEIELFLGFVEGAEALGTRVHKLENFLGIKAI